LAAAGFTTGPRLGAGALVRSGAILCPLDEAQMTEAEIEALVDAEDRRAAREALAEAEREGTIPFEELKAELGLN
jgi:hypothetical protein